VLDGPRLDWTVATSPAVPSETIHNMPFSVEAEIACDASPRTRASGPFRETVHAQEYATR
jgi:hypothetical protein